MRGTDKGMSSEQSRHWRLWPIIFPQSKTHHIVALLIGGKLVLHNIWPLRNAYEDSDYAVVIAVILWPKRVFIVPKLTSMVHLCLPIHRHCSSTSTVMVSIAHQKGPDYTAVHWRYVLKLTLVVKSWVLFHPVSCLACFNSIVVGSMDVTWHECKLEQAIS